MEKNKKKDKLLIPEGIKQILIEAGDIGDRQKIKVFAVGGFVRDLLLGRGNLDIDIVVEGDGLKFAQSLSGKLNGSLIMHEQFGTATIEAGCKVDIATARSEYYKEPAAYPAVKPGTIKDDLQRRDFTINAIALSLNYDRPEDIVDLFSGLKDLEAGIIRVLHDKSFIDDPTRILRAVRFEKRYAFKMDEHTEALARHAIKAGMLGRLKKQRIEKERAVISKEKNPDSILKRLDRLSGVE